VIPVELDRHSRNAVPELREELLVVHADARADLLDQSFYTVDRFGERLDAYAADPTFSLVTGHAGGELVGYAFGGTLPDKTRWWTGLRDAKDPDVTRETGRRTFGFRELLVRKRYQGHGIGRRLHDEMLADRPEERATLLVRVDNPARELYLRWGWTVVGTVQPFPDAPIMEAMVRPLR
jgi:ribosomal protein S18 acetylase RimI-like enzyme